MISAHQDFASAEVMLQMRAFLAFVTQMCSVVHMRMSTSAFLVMACQAALA